MEQNTMALRRPWRWFCGAGRCSSAAAAALLADSAGAALQALLLLITLTQPVIKYSHALQIRPSNGEFLLPCMHTNLTVKSFFTHNGCAIFFSKCEVSTKRAAYGGYLKTNQARGSLGLLTSRKIFPSNVCFVLAFWFTSGSCSKHIRISLGSDLPD